VGSINGRTVVQTGWGNKARDYYQNNQSTKGWRHGSNGRAPVYKQEIPIIKIYMYINILI
jgi:hypothetical protein